MARALVVCLVVTGCGVSEVAAPDVVVARKNECDDPTFCGTNSPVIAVHRSFAFNLDGSPNDEGISILGLTKQTGPDVEVFQLDVSDSRIRGIGASYKLERADLVGAQIWVELPTLEQAAITITKVGTYPEAVGYRWDLETYVLEWAPVLQQPLLGHLKPEDPFPTEAPVLGAKTYLCEEVTGPARPAGADGRAEAVPF